MVDDSQALIIDRNGSGARQRIEEAEDRRLQAKVMLYMAAVFFFLLAIYFIRAAAVAEETVLIVTFGTLAAVYLAGSLLFLRQNCRDAQYGFHPSVMWTAAGRRFAGASRISDRPEAHTNEGFEDTESPVIERRAGNDLELGVIRHPSVDDQCSSAACSGAEALLPAFIPEKLCTVTTLRETTKTSYITSKALPENQGSQSSTSADVNVIEPSAVVSSRPAEESSESEKVESNAGSESGELRHRKISPDDKKPSPVSSDEESVKDGQSLLKN